MTIEFTSNVDDAVAMTRHHFSTSATGRRTLRIGAAVVGLASAGASAATMLSPHPEVAFVAKVAISAFLGIAGGLLYRRVVMKNIASQSRSFLSEGKNMGVVGWHRLSIMDRTLREENEAGSGDTTFEALERIAETPTHVFVYTGATSAHVIRRNAVTHGDLEPFLAELRRRMAE